MLDSISNFLLNLKDDKIITVGLNFASSFCPTFLTIFFFDTNMFQSLDTIKLILLCFSIGCPFLLMSLFTTIGLGSSLKRVTRSLLEQKIFDKYNITHQAIDSITRGLSTRLACGFASSVSWIITGLITAIVSIFIRFGDIRYYGYGITFLYLVILTIISRVTANICNKVADGLDKKNDEDYALENAQQPVPNTP
ncbi:hypothetical protein ACFSR6_00075 [Pedobacter vanadiisoli]|uniref:ABC transmembrane type-1 domain-containing protein n=1 Tax=Pedobacter vanadiisoli TaxID=1761975 RepID=A0ABW5MCB1_9SPHI